MSNLKSIKMECSNCDGTGRYIGTEMAHGDVICDGCDGKGFTTLIYKPYRRKILSELKEIIRNVRSNTS